MRYDSIFPARAWRLLIVGLAVVFSALSADMAFAQAANPSDDEVNQIASQLYCPICENMPLDICPLEACRAWRELIREQLAEGWTEGQIKAYFAAQYGDAVLGEPPPSGLNWILYLVPPAIVLAGAILLITKMKHSTRKTTDLIVTSDDVLNQQREHDLENQ